jgi:esterase/lipase superfamily enzyme
MIAGIVLLTLLTLGFWFYQIYFSATNYALQRAETLNFRRMVIAQLDQQGSYRFFFSTNRQREQVPDNAEDPEAEQSPQAIEDSFGRTREPGIRFGVFDVGIEPTLGLGMLINPTEWFQNREIQLNKVELLEEDPFLAQLREVVDRSPSRSLLIIVHGFRDAFDSALRKTAFLGHVLDLNVPILVFDWPGNQGSSARGYRRALEQAKSSSADLAALISLIDREIAPGQMSIMANSMGGQVVVDAFRTLHKQRADGAGTMVEHVLLTAPDVDYAEFNEEFRQALEALSRHTTVYVSSNDRALLASRLLNRGRRLGQSTLRPGQAGRNLSVVDRDPNEDLVSVVDVTPVNRTRNFHNFSLETPEFYDEVYLRLGNPRIPRSRLIYPVEGPDGSIYWVLTQGR